MSTSGSTKNQDAFLRQRIAISTIPDSPNLDLGVTVVLTTNTQSTLISTVTPGYTYLSLWDFLYSISIDADDFDHRWPNGIALTSTQQNDISIILGAIDFDESDDTTNTRVYKVCVRNSGAGSHTIYFALKAYTFASVTGTIV